MEEQEGLMRCPFDAVDLCIALLRARYPDVTVTNEMPSTHPKEPYVLISRTGGEESEWVSSPIMTLRCWDSSDDGARRLAHGCVTSLQLEAEGHPLLSSAELLSIARDEYSPGSFGSYSADTRLTINKD